MPQLKPLPPEFMPGATQLSADSLNKLLRTAIPQVFGSKGLNANYYGQRLVLAPGEDITSTDDITKWIQLFAVKQEYDDSIQCVPFFQPWDSNNDLIPQTYDPSLASVDQGTPSQPVYVYLAKPYLLQKAPWDSQAATINGLQMTFAYGNPGRRQVTIANMPVLGGGTELVTIPQQLTPNYFPGDILLGVRAVTGLKAPDTEEPITWQDLNCGGRRWTAAFTEVWSVMTGASCMSGNLYATYTDVVTVAGEIGGLL